MKIKSYHGPFIIASITFYSSLHTLIIAFYKEINVSYVRVIFNPARFFSNMKNFKHYVVIEACRSAVGKDTFLSCPTASKKHLC